MFKEGDFVRDRFGYVGRVVHVNVAAQIIKVQRLNKTRPDYFWIFEDVQDLRNTREGAVAAAQWALGVNNEQAAE